MADDWTINLELKEAQIRAGVVDANGNAKYSLHKLRHFFASWCINRKKDDGLELPPKVVQGRMGHSNIRIAFDRYGHLFPQGDDSAELAAADAAFFSKPPPPAPTPATVTMLRPVDISSDAVYWTASGDILIMTMLGGAGTLIGTAVGAAAFLLMKNVVSSYSEHWLAVIGITFICCVMFFPGGIWRAGQLGLWRVQK